MFAEIWGTFLLVAAAAGASIAADLGPDKVAYSAAVVVPGLMVMVGTYMLGEVSGAHFNPAVTLAFALRRNFPWKRVPGYVLAQIVGAITASSFLLVIVGLAGKFGATTPGAGVGYAEAFAIEVLLTAGLVNTILATASGAGNVGPNAALAVGGYIALAGLWAGPVSGASMNPARSLAPDLLRGDLHSTWVYLIGPVAGALIGVVFEYILKGGPSTQGAKVAQGDPGQ
ncbi:MAG TPA: aquaporin [Caulobacteraceae bacterium]